MYCKVGFYPESRRLASLAAQLNPKPSEQGYATTDREHTKRLYHPLLKEALPGEWLQSFLAIIWANGSIPPHVDGDNEHNGSTRYHLVIQSNDKCWYLHGTDWQQLEEGGIYTFNPSIVHASINWGGEPRIHLVVDIK